MLKGAVLGLGNIALGGHLPVYARDPYLREQVTIVAGADLCEANRAQAKARWPHLRLYESAASLMATEQLDFIDICTPPATHRGIIETAVARGWHVLCEKPLATNLADLAAIAAILENPQVVFKPVHQYLYSPHWQAVEQYCRQEQLRPYYFQARVLRTSANQGNQEWAPAWRTNPLESGGGIVVDHGVHLFYLAASLMGEPKKVTALTRSFKHSYQVEDTALIILEFEHGITEISLSWAAQRRQIELLLLDKTVEILVEENQVSFYQPENEQILAVSTGLSSNSTHENWYPPLLINFVNKIIAQDYGSEKLHEALTAARCALAVYLSNELGRGVSMEEL